MSRHLLRLVALLFTLALGTGCASYMPFTQELRSEYDLADTDLENLQFYNSHTITLRRELSRDSRRITGGHELLMIAGKQIEEVVIDAKTPGVVVGASPSTLRVSFAEGSFLEFSLRGSVPQDDPVVLLHGGFAEPPEPFPGDRQPFVPPPPRRELFGSGNFWLLPSGGREVVFQGVAYDAVEDSSLAHLVISTESLEEVDEQKTVLKGRKL